MGGGLSCPVTVRTSRTIQGLPRRLLGRDPDGRTRPTRVAMATVTTSDGQPETVTVEEYVRHNPGLLEDEAIAYCEERSIPCRFELPKRRLRRS
jgi:hypothetical protein